MKKRKLFGFAVIALLFASMILFNACPEDEKPKATGYSITVESAANGHFEVKEKKAKEGAKINITVVPDSGFRLRGSILIKTASGDEIDPHHESGNLYSFTMPKANVTISGEFVGENEGNVITLTQPTTGGTIEASTLRALEGEEVTLTAHPIAGYKLQNFTVTRTGGTAVATEATEDPNTVTFVMPNVAVTVTATIIPEGAVTHNINLTQSKGGTIAANPESAIVGSTVTLTATASTTLEGFSFGSFSVKQGAADVTLAGTGNTRTFTMPDGAVDVTVVWNRATPANLYPLGAFNFQNNDAGNQEGWGFDGNGGNSNWAAFKAAKYLVIETKSDTPINNFGGIQIVLIAEGTNWASTSIVESTAVINRGTDSVFIVVDLDKLTGYAAVAAKDDGKLVVCYYTPNLTGLHYVNAYLFNGTITKPGDALDMATYGYITKRLKVLSNGFETLVPFTVTFAPNGGTPATIPSIEVFAGDTLGTRMPADPVKGTDYFTGWVYDTDKVLDVDTPITANITVTAGYKASAWTMASTELVLDLLGQQDLFHYQTATATNPPYALPLATSTVVAKNYGNIRIRFPGGFRVSDYEKVTIKYKLYGTSATEKPAEVTSTSSYVIDGWFYQTWNGYGKWLTAADLPTGSGNVTLSEEVQAAKGALLRSGGFTGPGNAGHDSTIPVNMPNPEGFQVSKSGGNSSGFIEVTEIKFSRRDPLAEAAAAVAELTNASSWVVYANANNLIKDAQTASLNAATVIASFKEKVESKIEANDFADFKTWGPTTELAAPKMYVVNGKALTINYVNSLVTGGLLTIDQATGWTVASKAVTGTAPTVTALTYLIGNAATDKAEYVLNLNPVAVFNVVFAANAHGDIHIKDGEADAEVIGHDTDAIVTRSVVRKIGSVTVELVTSTLRIGPTSPIDIVDGTAFTATSQVYTVNVIREAIPENQGASEIKIHFDQDWEGIPTDVFELSQQGYGYRIITLSGLGVSSGYTIEWQMDGAVISGVTGNAHTIFATGLTRGSHSLTVHVVKGGLKYSSPEIKFTVVR